MMKRKALRKILITTFALFTVVVIYSVGKGEEWNEFNAVYDVSYVSSLGMNDIYLLSNHQYLVRTQMLLEAEGVEEKVKILLDYLTIGKNDRLPVGLTAILPQNTKVYDVSFQEGIVTINLSDDLWSGNSDLEERMIEGLTYSITSLDEVHGLKLQVEGLPVTELPSSKKLVPEILTKDYGINKVYNFDSSSGIEKVTMYYLDQIQKENYYVPVTYYSNDDRDKINIIIEHLSSSFLYESDLISLLQSDVELMNYQIEDELMLLNFNHNLFNQGKLLEEITYQVAYSVFDNYDVSAVLFSVDGEEVTRIEK